MNACWILEVNSFDEMQTAVSRPSRLEIFEGFPPQDWNCAREKILVQVPVKGDVDEPDEEGRVILSWAPVVPERSSKVRGKATIPCMATGQANWGRIINDGRQVPLVYFSVGPKGSDAGMEMNTVEWIRGGPITIDSIETLAWVPLEWC